MSPNNKHLLLLGKCSECHVDSIAHYAFSLFRCYSPCPLLSVHHVLWCRRSFVDEWRLCLRFCLLVLRCCLLKSGSCDIFLFLYANLRTDSILWQYSPPHILTAMLALICMLERQWISHTINLNIMLLSPVQVNCFVLCSWVCNLSLYKLVLT